MQEQNRCGTCGVGLAGQAVEGMCANCMLRLAANLAPQGIQLMAAGSEISAGPEPVRYFGDYELIEEIARGGMGVVYRARQISLNRSVALKMILGGSGSSPRAVERFQTEAEAAARLEHPNIVPIYEIGACDGQLYFSMRFLEGGTLTRAMAHRRYDCRRAAELVMILARAVHYAHQRGILHRDLKPGNILFDQKGQPYITDFGLAKVLEQDSGLTQSIEVLGTPSYMAPEQAAGEAKQLSTAADIYSLGAVLYELLTGRAPFRDATAAATLRRVIEEEPVPPRRFNCEVARDLEIVCLKCLEKEPVRRYGSAEALADDLRHWLEDEPVTATPPSAGYLFRKFARRNKGVFALSVVLVLILITATVVSAWLAVRAMSAEKLAQARVVELASARDAQAEARREAEAISGFLIEMFRGPGQLQDGHAITVAEILDRAVSRLDTQLENQLERRINLQDTLAQTYQALGLHAQAVPLFRKVWSHRESTLGPEHITTLRAARRLADSLSFAGMRDQAMNLRERLLASNRNLFGPEHPETLTAMSNLATAYYENDRLGDALRIREDVLRLRQKVSGPEHPDTLAALHRVALSYHSAQRSSEALQILEKLLVLRHKILPPEHPDTIWTMADLGVSYFDAGRHENALRIREEVLALSRKVNGPEHPDTLWAMNHLGTSYEATARYDQALQLREEVHARCLKVLGPVHNQTLWAMTRLATSYRIAGRDAEAQKLLQEVVAHRQREFGLLHRQTHWAMDHLAEFYRQTKRVNEAIQTRSAMLELQRKRLGSENLETLRAMGYLANSYRDANRLTESIHLREEALAIMRRVLPEDHPFRVETVKNLEDCYRLVSQSEAVARLPGEQAGAGTLVQELATPP